MIHKIEHVDDGFVRVHRSSVLTGNSMVLPTRQGNLEHWEDCCLRVMRCLSAFDENQRPVFNTGTIPDEEMDETHSVRNIKIQGKHNVCKTNTKSLSFSYC